jgi:hypothetical protein
LRAISSRKKGSSDFISGRVSRDGERERMREDASAVAGAGFFSGEDEG